MRTLRDEMRLRKELDKQRPGERENPSVDTSLRSSLFDGGFFGLMSGFSEPFLVPFALLFNAPNILISMLSTLPVFIGSFFQLFAPRLLAFLDSRRKYLIAIFLVQGVAWLCLPFVALLPPGVELAACVLLAVLAVSLSHAISSVWLSYMGELVPERRRARFFSRRTAIVGAATFAATLAAGFLLRGFANVYLGFGVLFCVAAAARWGSAAMMAKSRELPAAKPKRPVDFSFAGFFHRAPHSDFGRFVGFAMLFRFSAYLAAPFFTVYQLKVLGFDYFSFTLLQGAVVVGSLLALQVWGRVLERLGTRRVLIASSFLVGIVPLLWLTTADFRWLLAFEAFSGVAWSGFNLAVSNYALEATDREARTHVFSYSSLLNNGAIFVAGLVGGLLLAALDAGLDAPTAPFLVLFALSGCLRLVVALLGAPRLRELRYVEIRMRETVHSFVSVLPQQGAVMAYGHDAMDVRDEVAQDLDTRRAVEEQLEQLKAGDDLVDAMPPQEKELYAKKFVERAKK